MIGLSPEQAQHAWEAAVAKAGSRKVRACHVKNAVKELKTGTPEATASPKPRPSKHAQRRLINDAIGQLLVLLTQKAGHDILREKVEALYGHFQALFPKTSKR